MAGASATSESDPAHVGPRGTQPSDPTSAKIELKLARAAARYERAQQRASRRFERAQESLSARMFAHQRALDGHPLTWEEIRAGKQYTVGEEVANAVTHGIGGGLAIAGLVLMIVTAVQHGGGARLASAIVFGVALLLEYTFSTLYHAIQPPAAKRVLRVFDHCMIYLLIAGTYTPFCLVTLAGVGGDRLAAVIWAAAALGIGIETLTRERQPKWVSAAIYLVMGWAVVAKLGALVSLLAPAGLALLVAGGLCYTVGVVFYLLKKVPYMHMVWHLCVLAGSLCHFFAVLLYVL